MTSNREKQNKYGEPWADITADIVVGLAVRTKDGRMIYGPPKNEELRARALACVNALAGCPDPLAFVEAIRGLANSLLDADTNLRACDIAPALSWLKVKS